MKMSFGVRISTIVFMTVLCNATSGTTVNTNTTESTASPNISQKDNSIEPPNGRTTTIIADHTPAPASSTGPSTGVTIEGQLNASIKDEVTEDWLGRYLLVAIVVITFLNLVVVICLVVLVSCILMKTKILQNTNIILMDPDASQTEYCTADELPQQASTRGHLAQNSNLSITARVADDQLTSSPTPRKEFKDRPQYSKVIKRRQMNVEIGKSDQASGYSARFTSNELPAPISGNSVKGKHANNPPYYNVSSNNIVQLTEDGFYSEANDNPKRLANQTMKSPTRDLDQAVVQYPGEVMAIYGNVSQKNPDGNDIRPECEYYNGEVNRGGNRDATYEINSASTEALIPPQPTEKANSQQCGHNDETYINISASNDSTITIHSDIKEDATSLQRRNNDESLEMIDNELYVKSLL